MSSFASTVRSAIACGVVLLSLGACSMNRERARVAVPGSDLSFVLEVDEKQMARYHFLVGSRVASASGFLGPMRQASAPRVRTEATGDTVRLSWGSADTTQSVTVDLRQCRIVDHSNKSAPLPRLDTCVSNA